MCFFSKKAKTFVYKQFCIAEQNVTIFDYVNLSNNIENLKYTPVVVDAPTDSRIGMYSRKQISTKGLA